MATLSISISDPTKAWLDQQPQDAGELVEDLLRQEQVRREKIANMQRLVDEAIESGFTDESLESIRGRARKAAGVSL